MSVCLHWDCNSVLYDRTRKVILVSCLPLAEEDMSRASNQMMQSGCVPPRLQQEAMWLRVKELVLALCNILDLNPNLRTKWMAGEGLRAQQKQPGEVWCAGSCDTHASASPCTPGAVKKKPAAQAAGVDPSQCSFTSRQNRHLDGAIKIF